MKRMLPKETGLTREELVELLQFSLCGQYPSRHRVERTGTEFLLLTEQGAARFYANLAGIAAARRVFHPDTMEALTKERLPQFVGMDHQWRWAKDWHAELNF